MQKQAKIFGRRELIQGLGLAGISILVVGCGDGREVVSQLTAVGPASVEGAISNNHKHIAILTDKQLAQGVAVELNIQGGGSHPHIVKLTAEQVRQIHDKQKVIVTSSNVGNHAHTVVFNA